MRGFTFTSASGNVYLYDDRTGFIVPMHDDKTIQDYESKYAQLINDCNVQIKEHPTEDNLKKYLLDDANGFRQLILEATSGCNLRCKYCIYGKHYPSFKGYDDKYLSLDTAIKAVDIYMENFKRVACVNPTREATIGFYGGEPLLNFNVIKEVVNYINTTYGKINLNITTNGMLFDEEAQKFLAENNFSIIVSLDGNKENHDRNRVTPNGYGSFDIVTKHINEFREKYPDYPKFGISLCYDYKTNLFDVEKFLDQENLFVTKFSLIDSNDTTYYEQFTVEEVKLFLERQQEFEERFYKVSKDNKIDKKSFLHSYIGVDFAGFAFHPIYKESRPSIVPYSGCCVPGEKMYVTIDGKIHMCEKINDHYPIGDVESGLDYSKIIDIISEYNKLFEKRCINCKVSKFCSVCYAQCCSKDGLKKDIQECINIENSIKQKMYKFVNLLEENPTIFNDVTVDYYKEIYEKVGGCFEF